MTATVQGKRDRFRYSLCGALCCNSDYSRWL